MVILKFHSVSPIFSRFKFWNLINIPEKQDYELFMSVRLRWEIFIPRLSKTLLPIYGKTSAIKTTLNPDHFSIKNSQVQHKNDPKLGKISLLKNLISKV